MIQIIKEEIQNKLDELKNEGGIIKKYYHFRSIGNFIYFFDELGNNQVKEKVYFTIIEYLDLVKDEPIYDINECITVYEEYIKPIGSLYENAFGFMPAISLWVVIFWVACLYGILYLFSASMNFYIIIGIIPSGYYLYFLKKKSERKVYGLKW